MKSIELKSFFKDDILQVKEEIRKNLQDKNKDVTILMETMPAEEGKLVRAILVLLGGGFGEIENARIIKIAAAIELLHSATLVHDDIVDEAGTRRGQETLHTKFNLKAGLFAGDFLFSQAYVLFSKNCSPQSIKNVSETIKFVCKSEISQYFSLNRLEFTYLDYLRRINGKCASLFALSLSIGAVEAKAPEEIIRSLRYIGYYAGMAFQMIDDLLDLSSTAEILGKPVGNDILQGIYNLPIIYEVKNGNVELLHLLENKQIEEAIVMIRRSKGYERAKELAKKYTMLAMKQVDKLPQSAEKILLKQLLDKLFDRTY